MKKNIILDPKTLRQKEEEKLKNQPPKQSSFSETDGLKLMNELHVHQIELEMQHDELMQQCEETKRCSSELVKISLALHLSEDTTVQLRELKITNEHIMRVKEQFIKFYKNLLKPMKIYLKLIIFKFLLVFSFYFNYLCIYM